MMFPQSLHQQYFNVFMVVPADLLLLHNLFILSLLQLFFFHYSSHSSLMAPVTLMAPVILLSLLQSFFSHGSSHSSLITPVILLSLLQLFLFTSFIHFSQSYLRNEFFSLLFQSFFSTFYFLHCQFFPRF